MNEKYLKKILSVEAEAQAAYEKAISDADLLPSQAEEKVNILLEKTRKEAEAEAARLVAQNSDKEMIDEIIKKSEMEEKQKEALAAKNFQHAVSYVIHSVIGRQDHS